MRKSKAFWRNFEESVTQTDSNNDLNEKTFTKTREEPDQRLSGLQEGTQTQTATREEPDQDPDRSGYSAIPRSHLIAGTRTFTEQREEPDQDVSCNGYAVIPSSKARP